MIMVCQIYFRHSYTTNGISSATGVAGAAGATGAARNTLNTIRVFPYAKMAVSATSICRFGSHLTHCQH
jgi:hypothetical protein